MGEHTPCRPAWHCAECGWAWPCDDARENLAVELSPSALILHMYGYAGDAAIDLPGMPAGEMMARFVGWTVNTGPARLLYEDGPR
jgi:hypothetical protein